ncbi:MAG TPA: 1-deoxy-D-xylulose-5-phosphate reductoisomerase [Bryobacterales bacterium]|nr:1-deoxy-D-xylulose-5-phosphate reductoisomerase [Bryobacterales bacterium]
MKRLAILGSTGSIGANTLEVVRESGGEFEVWSLAAGQNVDVLLGQVLEFRPSLVSLATPEAAELLERRLAPHHSGAHPQILHGPAGNLAAATADEVDIVVSAAVGVAGLAATYEAVRRGKRVALANKEVMVAAGDLVMAAAERSGAELLPVDSEHNGMHQCLRGAERRHEVRRLILTASGGPFRSTPAAELARVTPAQALRHPTWKMGRRITINSATLMNKGFEVIEACHLFGFRPDQVDVVIHPQSTVHAMIEFQDGSILAQLGVTDMKMPIQYALYYPQRQACPENRKLDWKTVRQWDFEPPDRDKFPALGLAYRALEMGGSAGCTLNAADEVAVAAFLAGRIGFSAMAGVVAGALSSVPVRRSASIAEVLEVDRESRACAEQILGRYEGQEDFVAGRATVVAESCNG